MALEKHQEHKRHWTCVSCRKSFSNGDSLDQHEQATGHGLLLCPGCDTEPFQGDAALRGHQQREGHFVCEECDGRFRSERQLDKHQSETGHGLEEESSSEEEAEVEEKLVPKERR